MVFFYIVFVCVCVLYFVLMVFFYIVSPQQEKRIFTNFHRQLFCWIDNWHGLTMADIRRMEDETQRELEEVEGEGAREREGGEKLNCRPGSCMLIALSAINKFPFCALAHRLPLPDSQ